MPRTAQQILEEARQLPPEEIDWLVESLLVRDTDESQEQVDAAWEAEVQRRLDEIDSGKVKLIPAEEVFARLRERARQKQKK